MLNLYHLPITLISVAYLSCRLSSPGHALDVGLAVLGRPQLVAVDDDGRLRGHVDRQLGVAGPGKGQRVHGLTTLAEKSTPF